MFDLLATIALHVAEVSARNFSYGLNIGFDLAHLL